MTATVIGMVIGLVIACIGYGVWVYAEGLDTCRKKKSYVAAPTGSSP